MKKLFRTKIPERLAFTRKEGSTSVAVFEQPYVVRVTHWIAAFSLAILICSGLQIFFAFPSFGPKVPQQNLLKIPRHFEFTSIGGWMRGLALGDWLAGAAQWHFTFMWLFAASGVTYLLYSLFSGHYRSVLFMPRDIRGVWPMARHYSLLGKKPPLREKYNSLQKLAYTMVVGLAGVSLLSGLVLYNPVQFSLLATLMGGFHTARIWHFAAMCGLLAFIPGHLFMVAIHGWRHFQAMLVGWKRDPEYLSQESQPHN